MTIPTRLILFLQRKIEPERVLGFAKKQRARLRDFRFRRVLACKFYRLQRRRKKVRFRVPDTAWIARIGQLVKELRKDGENADVTLRIHWSRCEKLRF